MDYRLTNFDAGSAGSIGLATNRDLPSLLPQWLVALPVFEFHQ
jgi:hypothetical protein